MRGKEVLITESENGASHTLQLDRLSDFVSHYTLDLVQHAKQVWTVKIVYPVND
jgi:hypothetical protein